MDLHPRMYCLTCGADRTVPNHAADPGPCPRCGGTARTSVKVEPTMTPLQLMPSGGSVVLLGNFASNVGLGGAAP